MCARQPAGRRQEKNMASIHLVERLNNMREVSTNPPIWESGYWKVSIKTAESLIGGDLYLHNGQLEASHFGGKILGYRVHETESASNDRLIFRIAPSDAHKGVSTTTNGWGNEKKLVW
jgi:hypothetical protein